VAPGFFKTRSDGPKNVGKDPTHSTAESSPTAAAGSNGRGPVNGPIKYKVNLGGKEHSVQVERV
jgi:methylmalonyl-CoA carboxyltransferase 5S subunit